MTFHLSEVHLSNPLAKQPPSYVRRKDYKMGRILGEGTFGIVRLATWTVPQPPKTVAVKIIPKHILKGNFKVVADETAAVKELHHPNIVRMYDNFESKDKFYLSFQPAMGGEVFERVLHTGHLTEHEAAHVVQSVARALQYIHSHGFVHRDIKPENIMYLTSPEHDPEARIVLVDFGVAQHLNPDGEKLRELAGSLGYAAPEVVAHKPYGTEIDMWSLGAVAYVMLSGHMPYATAAPKELLQEMLSGPVSFPGKYWAKISEEAKQFIRGLMNLDVKKRLTATEALEHPWIVQNATTPSKERPNIASGLKDNYQLRPKDRAPVIPPSVESQSIASGTHELLSSDDTESEDHTQAAARPAQAAAPAEPAAPVSGAGVTPASKVPSTSASTSTSAEKASLTHPSSKHSSLSDAQRTNSEHHSIVEGIKNMMHHHKEPSA